VDALDEHCLGVATRIDDAPSTSAFGRKTDKRWSPAEAVVMPRA
jgi:hypothetical protein